MTTNLLQIVSRIELRAMSSASPEAFRGVLAAKSAYRYACESLRASGGGDKYRSGQLRTLCFRNLKTALRYV